MKIITIQENSSYTLAENDIINFKEFLKANKSLPVKITGNTLYFDDYVIGSITVQDISIVIEPRITKLTPNHYFEMQLYNEGLLNNELSSILGENNEFGIQQNLTRIFLEEAFRLVSKGVEGAFIKVQEESNVIKGRIIAEKISPINLMQDLIPIEYDVYTQNTSFNKIIKLALMKILPLISEKEQVKLFALVNAYFEDIDVLPSELPILKIENESKIFYENDRYPTVIGLALKILNELRLNMKNNQILGSSYLVNSNNLFETYARKVLSDGLNLSVSKWDTPKQMGQISYKGETIIKSYIPDIIIDFHNDSNTALAVLDAKNKDVSNLQNIGKLPDLYQILFYCYSLNSNFGGLVYPCFGNLQTSRINIDSFKENNIFAFGIDFSKPLKYRNLLYIEEVRKAFRI